MFKIITFFIITLFIWWHPCVCWLIKQPLFFIEAPVSFICVLGLSLLLLLPIRFWNCTDSVFCFLFFITDTMIIIIDNFILSPIVLCNTNPCIVKCYCWHKPHTLFMNSITVLLWERHTYVFSLTDRTKMHMFFFLIWKYT
jgi:lysylphosphatidylglycerol synthetase-like protein (DUF2156 family)